MKRVWVARRGAHKVHIRCGCEQGVVPLVQALLIIGRAVQMYLGSHGSFSREHQQWKQTGCLPDDSVVIRCSQHGRPSHTDTHNTNEIHILRRRRCVRAQARTQDQSHTTRIASNTRQESGYRSYRSMAQRPTWCSGWRRTVGDA